MNRVFLTFDVEDFINKRSTIALKAILGLLRKHHLRAIFFITGHMAENLSKYPDIIHMLESHEIGYHSSSHSVRPTILEYTDVKNYDEAYDKSIERETSQIDPLTGERLGSGGISFLKKLFTHKEVSAFRAPGYCWAAPHLEALRDLGIQFDFSCLVSSVPVRHKSVTFYPRSVVGNWNGQKSDYTTVLHSILSCRSTVVAAHPNFFVNKTMWDSVYHKGNPKNLNEAKTEPRPLKEIMRSFAGLDRMLKLLSVTRYAKLIEVTPALVHSTERLEVSRMDFGKCYNSATNWAEHFFNYKPKFQIFHYLQFFEAV